METRCPDRTISSATVAGSDAWMSWTLLDGMTLPVPAVTSSTLANCPQQEQREANGHGHDDQSRTGQRLAMAARRRLEEGSVAMILLPRRQRDWLGRFFRLRLLRCD